MGLLFADARRLLKARESGVSFDRTLTISRQQLYLHEGELEALRGLRGGEVLSGYRFGEYSDRFWKEVIGVKELETVDASAYEGATIIHDLNVPVPATLCESFDAVVEAGSLEHIFYFPVAIASLMKMVKVGGSLFLTMVANNLCGHGFYQFSPELIYRVLSPENGFEGTQVVFLDAASPSVEAAPITRSYRVVDPRTVGCRVGLLSKSPVMMMVQARKTRHVEPFSATPQQSDYVVAWQGTLKKQAAAEGVGALARNILNVCPPAWRRKLDSIRLSRLYSLSNSRFYEPLD